MKTLSIRQPWAWLIAHDFEYLGDGVYAKHDGFGVWLLTNDHLNPTDKVYLEPSVLEALNRFIKNLRLKILEQESKPKED